MRWTTPASAALSHARRGWTLVPLRPGTALPARKWAHLTSTPPGTIAAYWPSPQHNPGILTGPSDLVVIDLDSPEHGGTLPAEWAGVAHGAEVLALLAEQARGTIPATYTVLTPRGGHHLYFRPPAGQDIGNSAGRVGPMVDVRGRGGLVVGAGSIREGKPYELADDRDPVMLPGWLAGLARRPVTRDRDVTRDVTGNVPGYANRDVPGYAAAAFRAEISILLATRRGHRNDQLNRSAFSLGTLIGAGELDETDVTRALLDAAGTIGLIADDGLAQAERTIASGLTAGMAKPRDRRAA